MEGKLRRRQGSTEQRQYNLLDKRSNWNSFQTISTRNCSNSLYALSILIFFPKKKAAGKGIFAGDFTMNEMPFMLPYITKGHIHKTIEIL